MSTYCLFLPLTLCYESIRKRPPEGRRPLGKKRNIANLCYLPRQIRLHADAQRQRERDRQTDSQTETEIGQNSDVGRGLEYKGDEISSLGVISAAMTWPWPWPWTHILYYNYI